MHAVGRLFCPCAQQEQHTSLPPGFSFHGQDGNRSCRMFHFIAESFRVLSELLGVALLSFW